MRIHTLALLFVVFLIAGPARAQEGPGLRVGVGADISGGLAYGLGLNYQRSLGADSAELGFMIYGGSYEEESNNGFNDYLEETTLRVFAVTANYLMGYSEGSPVFLVAGVGAGAFSVEWTESSETDTSLGTPFGSGSQQSEEGTAGGTLINVGVGRRVGERAELRLEAPVFFLFDAAGEASSVVPTLTVSGALRF